MKSLKQTRAPAVTLAAYMVLVGSMAYAVAASAGQMAADARAQHDCVVEHTASDVNADANAALEPNVALAIDKADAQVGAQPPASAKATKRSRKRNRVESSLFHF
ncbi:MAG: hypothetical protein E2O56_05635 [Gammaproteobacteria bacterium]|nr:MAG: hypothetical protein E2O56_05635 [Gammaproteobacteria bacterium]